VHFEDTEFEATSTQWTDGTAYFARVVSYTSNMFLKSGANVIKLFTVVIYDCS